MATSTSKPKQDKVQTEPNPELQAALTDPEQDRQEQHIVPESAPSPADERSAEAPGIRTEAEVVADHQADNERAAAALAANPHTADPAASTSAVKLPRVENRDRVVWFKRKADGRIDSVNEGTPEHGVVLTDADFEVLDSKPSQADIEKANA
ncbi:hypothetical protein [Blastococcus mobilis]|uniref:Uncharacterized protein n=1 Tax=Blastococcus mobilis TaxID=1938746 RepID=A0A238VFN3_9ACTN|nr:hypothetical protein [Blastococcus mobilis]SNR33066.1 hypothetical protein SAMN06272737_10386 [Blastococcus mobilis]